MLYLTKLSIYRRKEPYTLMSKVTRTVHYSSRTVFLQSDSHLSLYWKVEGPRGNETT